MGFFRGAVSAALVLLSVVAVSEANLKHQFTTWTPNECNFSADGRQVDLIMRSPQHSYANMMSKDSWMYGGIGAYIKLAAGYTAGTVTTLYLSSTGKNHCEFDYEFLGNETGHPYLLHTNIFVDGVGGREQQIRLWFDPTADYHYYNFQWNKDLLVFYIDNTPIRMFRNLEHEIPGFKYPKACPMKLHLSMWDGSQWATQGGRVKIDWTKAPFVANYKNFRMRGCKAVEGDAKAIRACQKTRYAAPGAKEQRMGGTRTRKLREVKKNYVHYNYCDDRPRYPIVPEECKYNVL